MSNRTVPIRPKAHSVAFLAIAAVAAAVPSGGARAVSTGTLTTAPTSADLALTAEDFNGNAPEPPDNLIFTGAATHRIPFPVPQGRLGLAPKIDLVYNSQKTIDGLVGVGWTLAVDAIERSNVPLKGGIRYDRCEVGCDVALVNAGATSSLVRTESGQYRFKIDGGEFVRFNYDPVAVSWTAYDKAGRKYQYGQNAASRQDDAGNPAHVFKWCLDRIEDSNGNYLTVSYMKDRGQIYPAEIRYAGNADPRLSVALAPKAAIGFGFEPRDAGRWMTSDLTGFNVTTALRLSEIRAEFDGVLAWKYALEYQYSAFTSRLLLKKVRRFGKGGVKETTPIDMRWTPGGTLGNSGFVNDTSYRAETTAAVVGGITGDFNGDGRADIAMRSGWEVTLYLGSDSGFQKMTVPTINYPADETGAKWVAGDFNGDGRTDFAYSKPGWTFWRVATFDGTAFVVTQWSTATYPGCTEEPCLAVGYGDAHDLVITGDFNGDGKTDIAHARDKWGGWAVSLSTGTDFRAQVWNVSSGYFAIDWIKDGDERILVGDFNGDRKTDIAHSRVGWPGWVVHVSNGLDAFVTWNWGAPGPVWRDGSEYFVAGDFDGDGRTDIARHYVEHMAPAGYARFEYYRSNGWTFGRIDDRSGECTEYYSVDQPAYHDPASNRCVLTTGDGGGVCYNWCQYGSACTFTFPLVHVVTGDFNGDGRTDIAVGDTTKDHWLVYARLDAFGQNSCGRVLGTPSSPAVGDFTGSGRTDILSGSTSGSQILRDTGERPDLLAMVGNGTGGATSFTYGSSSHFPNTLLPFSIPVVTTVTIGDGIGGTSATNYEYEGGYYDLAGAEFRGFGLVKQINPDGSVVRTWFHQKDDESGSGKISPWQNENVDYKGKPRRVDVGAADGSLVSTTAYTWQGSFSSPTRAHTYPVMVLLGSSYRQVFVGGAQAFTLASYGYDGIGNLTSVAKSGTDAESITITYVPVDWGSAPRSVWKPQKVTVTGSTSGKIRESTFNYVTGTGNLEWSEAWLDGGVNPRTSYTYYPEGNLKTVTDPRNRATQIDYDPTRMFVEHVTYPKTDSVTHEVWFSHDYVNGQVDNAWDENGNKTHVDFDDFGRFIGITHYLADGPTIAAKTKIDYHDGLPSYVKTSQLEAVNGTSETWLLVAYEYFDGLGRGIETVAPAATWQQDQATTITRTSYDAMGRPAVTRGPFLGSGTAYGQAGPVQHPWVQYGYDGAGRLETVRRSDGSVGEALTSLSYEGLKVTITDPDNKKASWKKDYLGRISEVTEYADAGVIYTTKYTHDAAGQLKRIDDQHVNYWTFDYDTLGRKKGVRDPDAGNWTYDYYADGTLWWQKDANGVRLDLVYDELGRVLTRTYSKTGDATATGTVKYAYDTAVHGKGLLASVSNENSSNEKVVDTVVLYDALGRPRSTSRTIAGSASTFTTGTEFDLSGRLSGLTYPDNYKVTYDYYPGTDVLQSVSGSDATVFATFLSHDASGQPGIMSFGNGANTYYTRDPLSLKLTGMVTELPGLGGTGTVDLLNVAIASSGAGDVTKLSDYVKGGALALPGGVFEYSHRHDALHRLEREALTQPLGTPVPNIAYQRHATLAHALGSATSGGQTFAFGYDANGNTTLGWDLGDTLAVGLRQVTKYNGDNMPERLVYSRAGLTLTADYMYDGAGLRARKTVGLNSTFYVGKHYEVVNGEVVKYIFAGDLRIAMVKGADTYYFHKDHLRSTLAVTGQAAASLPIWTGSYRLFGALREESGTRVTNYLYTDQEYEPESGLYYFGARYYDPVVGRFLTPDTIVPRPYDPQSLNRYAYVRNSPASHIDPDGHDGIGICIVFGGGWCSAGGGIPPYPYPYADPWSQPMFPYGGPYGGVTGGGSGLGPLLVPPPPPPTPQPVRPPPVVVPGELPNSAFAPGQVDLYIRTFAPWESFGGGFRGDNREFTTDLNATSRMWGRVTVNLQTGAVTAIEPGTSGTSCAGPPCSWVYGARTERANITMSVTPTADARTVITLAGANPLVKGAPDIDISLTLQVRPPGFFSFTVRGDAFPYAEVFAVGASGPRMLLTYRSLGGPFTGPLLYLPGANAVWMGTFQGRYP